MKKIGKSLMAAMLSMILSVGMCVTAFANSLNAIAVTSDDRHLILWIVVIVIIVAVVVALLLLLRMRNKRDEK